MNIKAFAIGLYQTVGRYGYSICLRNTLLYFKLYEYKEHFETGVECGVILIQLINMVQY